ncbi:GBF-interacting 1 isoform X3, partial [Olea europaea subsp. europaea]
VLLTHKNFSPSRIAQGMSPIGRSPISYSPKNDPIRQCRIKVQIGKLMNAVIPSPKVTSRPRFERMDCHKVAQNCAHVLAQTFESPRILANVRCYGYPKKKDTSESRSHGASNNSTQGSKSDADQGLPVDGERPSEVIPDHLQVQMADCSHLSFGSFGSGMSSVFSSGPSASMPVNSNLEEDHRDVDVSSVEHLNTRTGASSESYDASQPEELKMVNIEMAHGNQYAFPPYNPDYTFYNAQHLNAAFAQSQTNSQMQNLSSFSNVVKQVHTNSLPSTMLAANVHSGRESDLQYSPFSVTQSLPTKSGNSASSIGGSAISMPKALKTSSFPSTQPTPESLFGKNVATGPPLPQHLPSFTYMPSAFQQQFADNNTYHQSSAAILPQYKNSVSVSSLPQSAAVASGYDGFGSTTTIPGNFLMNMPTAPSGTNLSYDDVLSSRYKDSNHLISLQQNENSAMWLHGTNPKTVSAVLASTLGSRMIISNQIQEMVRLGGLKDNLSNPNRYEKAADPELEAIRQRRMQELMAQRSMGNPDSEQQKSQDDAKREAEEQRQMMLSEILTSEARARLARIALVKPEKARGVEDVILRAAQMGQIAEKVSEERLISLLEQFNTQTTKETKVTIRRRPSVLDDE